MPANSRQKLTNTLVSRLPAPEAGQTFFYDSEVKPFAVRVTATGHRSFIVNAWKNGRLHRVTIGNTDHLFPGPGSNGHLIEPKRTVARVIEESGVRFTPHDLRRTFATAVNNLERSLSYYSIKRLLNHKSQDVTAGYIQHDVESLRAPMQQVTDYLLKAAGARKSAEVIEMQAASVMRQT